MMVDSMVYGELEYEMMEMIVSYVHDRVVRVDAIADHVHVHVHCEMV